MNLKNIRRGRISEYADKYSGALYTPIDPQLDYNPFVESSGRVCNALRYAE
jgi:hypothetical protein